MRKISVAVMMMLFVGLAGATCFAGQVDVNTSTAPTSLAGQNVQTSTVVQVPAPKPEDLVALHIGTTTVMADMTGIAQNRRESIAAYLQAWFDFAQDKISASKLGQVMRKLNITDDDQVASINTLAKMLTDGEYLHRWTDKAIPLDSFVKLAAYNAFTQMYYEKCADDLGYEACVMKRLLPQFKDDKTDPKRKIDLVNYFHNAANDAFKAKEFRLEDWNEVYDAMIEVIKNKQNPLPLRSTTALTWLGYDDRKNLDAKTIEFFMAEPKLFTSLGMIFSISLQVKHDTSIAEPFLVILEHPHDYPEDMVKGAYEFIEGDSYNFLYDTDGSRRKREKKILYQLKADKEISKFFDIGEVLKQIAETEQRLGLK